MIYIDASRYSNTKQKTGVENYSFHLINELIKKHKKEITLISPKKNEIDAKQIIIPFKRLWTIIRLSLEILKNKKIDNLFVPSHILPIIHPKQSTITIHDVVFKYSTESYSFKSRIYLNWATKFAVKHAKTIITPSVNSKKDLIKFYKANSNKIKVIPLGFTKKHIKINKTEKDLTLKKYKIKNKDYFLYIGRIEYKKNSDTLIKAFSEFAKNNKTKLLLAGFLGHKGAEIIKLIPNNLKDRIILTGYISEIEKNILLKNTKCFIFPSRFEGFGIPLLEAMNTEVPIIASDIPSSKELAKNSILYFKTNKIQSLIRQMKKIEKKSKLSLYNKELYKKILQNHSWEKCAQEIYEVIKK